MTKYNLKPGNIFTLKNYNEHLIFIGYDTMGEHLYFTYSSIKGFLEKAKISDIDEIVDSSHIIEFKELNNMSNVIFNNSKYKLVGYHYLSEHAIIIPNYVNEISGNAQFVNINDIKNI